MKIVAFILYLTTSALYATCKDAVNELTLHGDKIANGEEMGAVSEVRAAIFHSFRLQGKASRYPITKSSRDTEGDRDMVVAGRLSWLEQQVREDQVEILSFVGRSAEAQAQLIRLIQGSIRIPGERLPHHQQEKFRTIRNGALAFTGIGGVAHLIGFSGGPLGALVTVPLGLATAAGFHWMSKPSRMLDNFGNLGAAAQSHHLDLHVEILQDPRNKGWAVTSLPYIHFDNEDGYVQAFERALDIITFHDPHTHAPNTTTFLWTSPEAFRVE